MRGEPLRTRPVTDRRLEGRVAIVTGGAGTVSIGRSSFIRLAEEGAKVAVLDIDGPGVERVAEELRSGEPPVSE